MAHEGQRGKGKSRGRGYEEPFNRGSRGRRVPVDDDYDWQPQSVSAPDEIDNEKFVLFLFSLY